VELDWNKYIDIATKFQRKAKPEDRQDLKQDIIVKLATIASNNGHEPFGEGAMVRVASFVTMSYWRDIMRKPATLSLDHYSDDRADKNNELWQTLVDDKAIDLESWQDAKTWLLGCPKRLVQIAYKRYSGKSLDHKEQLYLLNHRQKELKKYQSVMV